MLTPESRRSGVAYRGEMPRRCDGNPQEPSIRRRVRHHRHAPSTPNRHVSSSLPPPQTSMTRPSLDALINDARSAGMRINAWIDIQQLSDLDEGTGKIAYPRPLQEGLAECPQTRRGSAGVCGSHDEPRQRHPYPHQQSHEARSLRPERGARIPSATDGNGLAGLTARVQTAGGTCRYGHDDHHVFHLDVAMPWIACQADRMKP